MKLALPGGQFDVVVPAKKAAADVMVKAWGKKAEADSHVEFKWPDSKTTMIVPVPEGLSVGQSFTIGARLGVGFDWYLTKHLVLNTEAGIVATTLKQPDIDDIEDLNYLSFQAGLQYRF